MKHIVKNIIYRQATSTGTWYNILMIPSSGTLNISSQSTDHGRIRTYQLDAVISRAVSRHGDTAIDGDLCMIITYENSQQARIGTPEHPARLSIDYDLTLKISCQWQEVPGTAV